MSESIAENGAYCNIRLKEFHQLNPECFIIDDDSSPVLKGLWGEKSAKIPKAIKLQKIFNSVFNRLAFDHRLDAIIHNTTHKIEFAHTFIRNDGSEESDIANRKFSFHFKGRKFECEFASPSFEFLFLAKQVTRSYGYRMPQLYFYYDYLDSNKSPSKTKFFKNREPINFFIFGDFRDIDIYMLFRYLNRFMCYFDREAPTIVVRPLSEHDSDEKNQSLLIKQPYPPEFSVNEIDETLLNFLEVAAESEPRMAFLYYFQIIEHKAFYHIETKAKSDIAKLLRDPLTVKWNDSIINEMFEILADCNKNDESRQMSVIEEFTDLRQLWHDIDSNRLFFTSPVQFEGGYSCKELVNAKITIDQFDKNQLKHIFGVLNGLRNVLAHAREKREPKNIKPCYRNDELILMYLPIIRRIAEDIAIRSFDS